MTGGTFIERGDNNAFTGPSFSGTGTIVNDSPYARSVYKVANAANGVTTWAGCISDGGATIARANSGPGYQMNVDINGSMPAGAVLYITGSNHMSGFLRLSGANDTVKMGPGSVLFYCPSIGPSARQLLMNSGTWDLNGTSQQVGTVYTGNDSNSKITNSANGTVSTLIMGVNVTNLLSYNTTNNNPATYANPGKYPQMIRSALLDDPSTGGTLAITKQGIGIQSMGNFSGDGTPLPSNYHGDTTINNGTLEVLSTGVVSPNSAFRLNTTQATLRLLYSGNANVKQLFLNGVQQPNGVYGSGNVSAISGSGTITVTASTIPPANNVWAGGGFYQWDHVGSFWTTPAVWVDGQNAIFDATGAASSPVTVADAISAGNLNFNTAGYTINGLGGTLSISNTVTANQNAIIAVELTGANGLVKQGSGTLSIAADTYLSAGNNYTGGTYVRAGTLILSNSYANTSGTSYAVDSIEALDAGATVVIGTTTTDGGVTFSNVRGQIGGENSAAHLHMTGGTLDVNNDNKNQRIPVPDGTGLIVNNGSLQQSGLQIIPDGLDHTWSGIIADGNNGVLNGLNNTGAGKGPGYQIGIVQASGTGNWTWTGANTYSGSTRLDGGIVLKLSGAGTLGRPTLTNGMTGPMRWYTCSVDLNGTTQTISLMTAGNGSSSKVYNSAVGTTSTLVFGYGMEQAFNRNANYYFTDNLGTGGKLSLKKINTQPYMNNANNPPYLATNCLQQLSGTCDYSGDTIVDGGWLWLNSTASVSPNSAYRLATTNQALLKLAYSGNAPVRQLWINGVQQPNGTYGASTAGIDPASTGTITVTASTIPPANNVWAGGGFYQWDHVGSFWTTPAVWVDGQNAIFDATGAASSPVTVADAISAGNLNFNTAGYTINGLGGTLSISNTVTANQNAIIAVELTGANGLVKQGSGTLSIAADTYLSAGNNYTGGTYVRAGTLILSNSYANTSGTSYAVDSIEALDAGATVVIGTTTTDGGVTFSNVRGQIGGENSAAHLHMTGGTLDVNNDNKNQRIPVPDGTGLIVNNGSLQQSGLQIIPDGLDHTWSGIIADGNNGVLNGLNNTGAGKGPGYQIGIVQASGTGNWTWTGANTYSGSTRLDGGIVLKLSGAGTLGRPTLTNGMTGPMRWYTCSVDLNGTTQTISLMTAGNGSSSKVYNSAVGTTSTLVFGYGMEQAFNRNANYYFTDNLGTGGKLSLKKINTQPYMNNANNPPYLATNCLQQLSGTCDYSGDTIVDGGWLWLNSTASVSPNSAYRLATTNQALLKLAYSGNAPVRQLWINGVQQPNGTYGASTAGIDPASTGTITVTGSTLVVNPVLGVTKSGNALTFTWTGSFTLQAQTNTTSQGLGTNWVNTPYTSGQSINIDSSKGAVFFRLKQ